jgi:hypothetical protein
MQHVQCWFHVSWAEIKDSIKFTFAQKSLFLSNVVHKRATGMLTAGMSTRAVSFQNHKPPPTSLRKCGRSPRCITTADHVQPSLAQDLHIRLLHLWDQQRGWGAEGYFCL